LCGLISYISLVSLSSTYWIFLSDSTFGASPSILSSASYESADVLLEVKKLIPIIDYLNLSLRVDAPDATPDLTLLAFSDITNEALLWVSPAF